MAFPTLVNQKIPNVQLENKLSSQVRLLKDDHEALGAPVSVKSGETNTVQYT